MVSPKKKQPEQGYIIIFRPWITLRDGRRIRRPGGGMWPIRIRVA